MLSPLLHSPRLILRQYQESDCEAFAALNGNAEARHHLGGILTKAEATVRFQGFMRGDVPGQEAWAVTLRENGTYIGHSWLVQQEAGSDPEIGFIINPKVWGQGYGTEVAVAVVDHAINRRGHPRVTATVDADHPASIRVLERAGMKRQRERQDEHGLYFVYATQQFSPAETPGTILP